MLRARRLSECLSLAELAPPSSLYVPLAPPANLPHIQRPPGSVFHASALCAATFDTLTLPYRLLHGTLGACDLHSLTQLLVGNEYFTGQTLEPAAGQPLGSGILLYTKLVQCQRCDVRILVA